MQSYRILNTCINNLSVISVAARQFQYKAVNDTVLTYKTGSSERVELEKVLNEMLNKVEDVPICIGDEEIRTEEVLFQKMPFDHSKNIAKFYYADDKIIRKAIKVSLTAREKWEKTSLEERAKIFIKAADLISTKYRPHVLAATMLGQAKTIFQAEIDAAAETVDFLRFNVQAALELSKYKPIDTSDAKNTMEYRGMEGFWAAVTPFNFTAIAANLPSAPAIMGNVVLWKPTDTAVLSNYIMYKIFRECGVPPGVINFVTSDGPRFGRLISTSSDLTGLNFTGSVKTFQTLFQLIGSNISNFKYFPRLIGECGGKNFHFVHPSADLDNVAMSTVRSAFEFCGQKCSACSRLYVPESCWPTVKSKMIEILSQVKMGSPLTKDTFLSAVIDKAAFDRIKSYIDYAKKNNKLTIEHGGTCDNSTGYFIEPTIIKTTDPQDKIMKEEIFGPVITVFVYPDASVQSTLDLVDNTTPFALTGAVFAQDEKFLALAKDKLRQSTGNFYLNVQSTGSVVGQQPFGGARLSGTNDKAGGPHYVLRFASPCATKIQTGPIQSWKQPHMV